MKGAILNKLQFIQWLRKINLTKELVADTYHDKYLSLYLAKKIADEVWSIKIEKEIKWLYKSK